MAQTRAMVKTTDYWKDENALYNHYMKKHPKVLKTNTPLSEAYHVIFVETPDADKLDTRENYWISKVNATINIARTFMPKYK